ncbi:hypothetical protein [Streptomyces sp. NPDC052225]|uniref:hypothetical protein n=1 Tax=Streptomyces sp. NPDC052225 TaxID=3154949 RepID=UPI00341B30CC
MKRKQWAVRVCATGAVGVAALSGAFASGAYAAEPEPTGHTVIMSNEEAEAAGFVATDCYEPGVYYFGGCQPRPGVERRAR